MVPEVQIGAQFKVARLCATVNLLCNNMAAFKRAIFCFETFFHNYNRTRPLL